MDSLKTSMLFLNLYSLYLSHINLHLPGIAVIIGISFVFFSTLGNIRSYQNRVSLYSWTQPWVNKKKARTIRKTCGAVHCILCTLNLPPPLLERFLTSQPPLSLHAFWPAVTSRTNLLSPLLALSMVAGPCISPLHPSKPCYFSSPPSPPPFATA